ncbi:MAG TPA: hypothetical protein VE077_04330 [Candidatus Methylomirabilis sp.]|nr:hypothetical protein [Candidatus Methylomirabilis sp.]
MRTDTLGHGSTHHAKPLVIRGGLARTFGSLVSFLAGILIFVGLYLLDDAFVHPLHAYAAGTLAAAFSITLGVILFYYLLKPRNGARPVSARFRREE